MFHIARKIKIYRPLIIIISCGIFFVVVRTVFTQPTAPTPAPEFGYKQFSEVLGLILQLIIALGVVVGVVFFFWRGKSNEQLKEQVAGWKDTAERRQIRTSELEADQVRATARIRELRDRCREERKKVLRLQARIAGEVYEESIDEDFDDEH